VGVGYGAGVGRGGIIIVVRARGSLLLSRRLAPPPPFVGLRVAHHNPSLLVLLV
jgi:hypothetical protein